MPDYVNRTRRFPEHGAYWGCRGSPGTSRRRNITITTRNGVFSSDMSITISDERGLSSEHGDSLSLECPYCGVFAHMRPQSVPSASELLEDRPKHLGLVYQCDACRAPVFLRFAVKEYRDDEGEL